MTAVDDLTASSCCWVPRFGHEREVWRCPDCGRRWRKRILDGWVAIDPAEDSHRPAGPSQPESEPLP